MRVFKVRAFCKWALKEGVPDTALKQVVNEMELGLSGVNLGGSVFKKRVAIPGRGKRGGARILLVYRSGDKVFFVYGFAKNVRENLGNDELKALKYLAKELLAYNDDALMKLLETGALTEL